MCDFFEGILHPKVVLTLIIGICMAVIIAAAVAVVVVVVVSAQCTHVDAAPWPNAISVIFLLTLLVGLCMRVQITKLIFIDYNNCRLNTDPMCSSLLFTHSINYYCQFTNVRSLARTHPFNNRSALCVCAMIAMRPLHSLLLSFLWRKKECSYWNALQRKTKHKK